jgi:hypothetical protein
MTRLLLATTVLCAAAGLPSAAIAQAPAIPAPAEDSVTAASSGAGEPRRITFGVWMGVATDSPRLGVLGDTPGRDLFAAGVRASWPVWRSEHAMLEYTLDLIPLALISDGPAPIAPGGRCQWSDCGTNGFPLAGSPGAERLRAYGAGLAPLGVELTLRRTSRLRVHAGASGGALLFSRAVPLEPASHFNFTADMGVGVTIVPRGSYGVTLGYRFHHISNGGLAPWNPAVASHMLVVGARRVR